MHLPPRPQTIGDPATARQADAIALELFELNETLELWEQDRAHRGNFKRARQNMTELDRLLNDVPSELENYVKRVDYLRWIIANEMEIFPGEGEAA